MFLDTPVCSTVRMTKINASTHFERRQIPVVTVFQGNVMKNLGHAVAQLVEALTYKPEGCGFDSRWCHWNFSLT